MCFLFWKECKVLNSILFNRVEEKFAIKNFKKLYLNKNLNILMCLYLGSKKCRQCPWWYAISRLEVDNVSYVNPFNTCLWF